jgi:PhzF family phenazine biosynthesis protein
MSVHSLQAFVFASDLGNGNEARVVVQESGGCSAAEMQRFAAEQAVPVVAFLQPQVGPWKVRFFTRRTELPYCGHGVLAAASVALERQGVDSAVLVASSQQVVVQRDGARVTALTTRPCELTEEPRPDLVTACFAWRSPQDARLPIWRASIGSPKWLVPVSDLEALYAVELDAARLTALGCEHGVNGVYMYTTSTNVAGVDAEARAFNPASGANEDSATGVGAGALAWVLQFATPQQTHYVVRQGRALGQDNQIIVDLGADGTTRVGGNVKVGETHA